MTDYAAQLLNELMGRNRDLLPDQQAQKLSYDSPEVCHYYLVKLCPHDLFTNTRVDLGPCGGIHDDDAREEFLKLPSYRRVVYEDEFLRYCQSMLNEVERKIRKSRQRLELQPDDEKLASLVPPQFSRHEERIASLTGRITKLVTEAEELGCKGQVDEAQSIMRLCDKLKDERDRLKRNNESSVWHQAAEMAASQEKQMQVCDICGAFLILSDAQQRIDDHLTGKQHLGYARLRKVVDEIREGREQEKKEQEAAREKEREERRQREGGGGGADRAGQSGPRDRERSSRSDRDRDRERERERASRNGDRDRSERNGERDRTERRRYRSRSRDRDRDRHRYREPDRRDRDQERRDRDSERRDRDSERRDRDSERRDRDSERRDRDSERRDRDSERRDRDPERRDRDSERRDRDSDRYRTAGRDRTARSETDPDRDRDRHRDRRAARRSRSRSRSRRRSREHRDSRDRYDEGVRGSPERTGPRTPSAEPPDVGPAP